MPRADGTGPMARGPMTGRSLGFCTGTKAFKYGAGFGAGVGFGWRRGFGRGFGGYFNNTDQLFYKTEKEMLEDQKNVLQSRLEDIDKQLGNL